MDAPARHDGKILADTKDPLAALGEEVRRAGRLIPDYRLRAIRWWFFVTIAVMTAGAILPARGLEAPALVMMLPLPLLLWGVHLEARHRRTLKVMLRESIARQRGSEVEAVLESLASETDPMQQDAAALARDLLRELGPPRELTPSAAPKGSGAEVSATDG